MKIKFLYIENGKITLTKQELEQLLEESYQDGVTEGRKSNNSGGLTYQPGERELSDYYPKPYWGIERAIPVTCNDPNVVKISSSGDSLDWTEAGTITNILVAEGNKVDAGQVIIEMMVQGTMTTSSRGKGILCFLTK